MELIKIAGASLNQTPLDWTGNQKRILNVIRQAKKTGVQILCLQELVITGYGCEDLFLSLDFIKKVEPILKTIIKECSNITVAVGFPIYHGGHLYNAVMLIQNKKPLGINCKRVLAREGIHYEPRWFTAWPKGYHEKVNFLGYEIPIGDFFYDLGGVQLGIEICEEAWGGTPLGAYYAECGAEIILNPSASHFALGKHRHREKLVMNASRAMNVHYLYVNAIGLEASRAIYDGGSMIASSGELIAQGPRFGFKQSYLFSAEVDLLRVRTEKLSVGEAKNNLKNNSLLKIIGEKLRLSSAKDKIEVAQYPSYLPEEEFLLAEAMGLFDYLRKSGAKGYTVSLSGGCDSSVVSVLVAQMLALSEQELGIKNQIKEFLTCVYIKTKNNSPKTEVAAQKLAHELKATFYNFSIDDIVQSYTSQIEKKLKIKLSWKKDDISLQNIQARSRSPLAWFVANLKNQILLCTSNRSEASTGYATMDGDTSGGLSPIATVDKHFLRHWLIWAEKKCTLGLGPIHSLSYVNQLTPTAELRPLSNIQEDEKDLMPYELLQNIEECFIKNKMDEHSTFHYLIKKYKNMDSDKLENYIWKFSKRWQESQWKRERLATAFHVGNYSVDSKTYYRYPLLTGR